MRSGARRWALAGSVVIIVAAALPATATSGDPVPPSHLQRVVDRLGEEAGAFDRSAIVGISVQVLDTGVLAEYHGDQWLKAASSLKPTWLAAAIRVVGIDQVEPLADGVFRASSNEVGGRAIELAGGLDAVNAFTSGLGMRGTLVVEWTFGGEFRSSEYPGPHPALNLTTAHDLASFWRNLYQGRVLGSGDTDIFLEWGRRDRWGGYASGLVARLPEDAQSRVSYKMGWLPPGRTEEDEETGETVEVDALDVVIGSGVVEIPGGATYVVAIGTFGGDDWLGKVGFVSYASCRIYEAITHENRQCDRPGDPYRIRQNTDPPRGAIDSVSGDREFLSIRGWVSDPDSLGAASLVRLTVDGLEHGAALADDPHSWGADPFETAPGHGFSALLLVLLSPGAHDICAIAVNDGRGADTDIGCERVTIR